MPGMSKKQTLSTFFLLAMMILAVGTPEAGISRASGVDDERNIEKIAVKRVQPSYPPNAQKYRIEGVVTVQVNVGSDGKVTKAEFIRGNNLFRSVSLDAAKRWEFKGSAESSREGTIRFIFKLSQ
jgi:TonB family protein